MNKKKKESNKWVLFVKEIQKQNNIKYFEALKMAKPLWKKKKEEDSKEEDKSMEDDKKE